MTFDPIKGLVQMTPEDAKSGALYLLYAIKQIKIASNLPLTPYKLDGPLRAPDFAMKLVLDAAERLGIDLGARWGNEIDSSQHG